MKTKKTFFSSFSIADTFLLYILFIFVAGLLSWVTHSVPIVQRAFTHVPEGIYLAIALLFTVGFCLNYFAPKTSIPSFVWAILFGMALQPPLVILTQDADALLVVIELLAAFVLFAGGVEVPMKNFKKYFAPIASISIIGTLLTVLIFALLLEQIAPFFGVVLPAATFLLIAAILASTDPSAIIPTLKTLRLNKPFLRDIAVSESAVNDVAGTIFTRFFLVSALVAAASTTSVLDNFLPVLARDTLDTLALEVIWGVIVGLGGSWILHLWATSVGNNKQHALDPALFFAVPIFCFALGSLVGGSGFLAAFVAGLLFESRPETEEVRRFYETFVDGFIKPVIFLLLGAIVPLVALLSTAWLGVVAAFLFMLVVRPIIVVLSLLPWAISSKALFSWREILFLSFIRETGAIPAILILIAVASGVVGSEYIFAIGMWVILMTLLFEPPLTPILARKLGIVKEH